MKYQLLIALFLLCLFAACTTGEAEKPTEPAPAPQGVINTCDSLVEVAYTEDKLYELAYMDRNFYEGHPELVIDGSYLYSTHHGELSLPDCATSKESALEMMNNMNPEHFPFDYVSENDMYYVFKFPLDGLVQHIYKCNYFKPTIAFERPNLNSWELGRLTQTPVTEASALAFTYYYDYASTNYTDAIKIVSNQSCQFKNNIYIIQGLIERTPIDRTNNEIINLYKVILTFDMQTGLVTKTKAFAQRIIKEKPAGQ